MYEELTIGFSPCPNDTYIFYAMVHGKVDTEGIHFWPVIADVETLNQQAVQGALDITKLSYHGYAFAADQYIILDSGSALGKGNGPLLVSKKNIPPGEIQHVRIAIPGKYTTASLLLKMAYPGIDKTKEYLFSSITDAILNDEADAGLLIHESRFTYQQKGLSKIIDLGEFWENKTSLPLPLGGIAAKRDLPEETWQKVNRSINRSIRYAMDYPKETGLFVKKYARELSGQVIADHIHLFVNDYSISLGVEGKKAVKTLLEEAVNAHGLASMPDRLFIS